MFSKFNSRLSKFNNSPFPSPGHLKSIVLAAVLLSTSIAQAHEFWLEPSQFHTAPNELITLNLFVGEPFAGEVFGRHQSHINRFKSSGEDVLGLEGNEAAGYLRPNQAGQIWVEYLSESNVQTHSADKFLAYLTEEGLLPFFDSSRMQMEKDQTVTETYFRCAKTFIEVGTSTAPGRFQEPLGHPLEIVPQFDLGTHAHGRVASFLVLSKGSPLKDVPVMVISKFNPQEIIRLRSDQHGIVEFDQLNAGVWLVAAIYTSPIDPSSLGEAPTGEAPTGTSTPSHPTPPLSWQTYWSSLTFEYSPIEG